MAAGAGAGLGAQMASGIVKMTTPSQKAGGGKSDSDSDIEKVAISPTAIVDAAAKASPDNYKHGGKVRKTGYAKVHKGERVLTKAQQQKLKSKRGGKSSPKK